LDKVASLITRLTRTSKEKDVCRHSELQKMLVQQSPEEHSSHQNARHVGPRFISRR